MTQKYQFVPEDTVTTSRGAVLTRIRALVDIPEHAVVAGSLGGYIESYDNLSHEGAAWVDDEAWAAGGARVYDHALVCNFLKYFFLFCTKL
jgi:hypothetical protein